VAAPPRFAVFGCGNSNYCDGRYQAVGKKVEAALLRAGAREVCARGEGDDKGEIEEDFEQWEEKMLMPALVAMLEADAGLSGAAVSGVVAGGEVREARAEVAAAAAAAKAAKPNLVVFPVGKEARPVHDYLGPAPEVATPETPFFAPLVSRKELFRQIEPGFFREAIHFEFHTGPKHSGGPAALEYKAGDHIGIVPRNEEEVVERYLKRLGMSGKEVVSVTDGQQAEHSLARENRVADLLAWSCDLTGKVKRSTMARLAELPGVSPVDKGFLKGFDVKAESKRAVVRLIDILEHAKSVQMDFGTFMNICPKTQSRFYSISSSPEMFRDTVHVTAAVPHSKTLFGEDFHGLTTNYLKNSSVAPGSGQLSENEGVFAFIRPSKFKLPEDPSIPCIFVSAGTGCAPFRGFIQELSVLKSRSLPVSTNNFFFNGMMHEDVDYMYKDELESYEAQGVVKLVPAFSHDPPSTPENPIFAQTKIMEHAPEILELLMERDARIYVCGNARTLAAGAYAAFEAIGEMAAGKGNGHDFMERLVKVRRYSTDIFDHD